MSYVKQVEGVDTRLTLLWFLERGPAGLLGGALRRISTRCGAGWEGGVGRAVHSDGAGYGPLRGRAALNGESLCPTNHAMWRVVPGRAEPPRPGRRTGREGSVVVRGAGSRDGRNPQTRSKALVDAGTNAVHELGGESEGRALRGLGVPHGDRLHDRGLDLDARAVSAGVRGFDPSVRGALLNAMSFSGSRVVDGVADVLDGVIRTLLGSTRLLRSGHSLDRVAYSTAALPGKRSRGVPCRPRAFAEWRSVHVSRTYPWRCLR